MFHNAQHGFLQGRSTVTQLLAFYHEIGQSLDKSLQSDIVYLDLAKAFDSVSHQRLLLKLFRYGVSGKLLQWFESYLGERGQQCLVHGFTQVALQFHQESLRAVSSVLLPVIQNVPMSLKVYKIMSHSKRKWTVCMAGPIIGT